MDGHWLLLAGGGAAGCILAAHCALDRDLAEMVQFYFSPSPTTCWAFPFCEASLQFGALFGVSFSNNKSGQHEYGFI